MISGKFFDWYETTILGRPRLVLLGIAVFVLLFASQVPHFRLDVSPDSLVLENDADLSYYRAVHARYRIEEYLILTYTSSTSVFAQENITAIRTLQRRLEEIESVESVTSILNVPLLQSPPLSLQELRSEIRTLDHRQTDLNAARLELRNSPLYRNRLVSSDGKTTALQVNFRRDERYHNLRRARDELRERQLSEVLTLDQRGELARRTLAFKQYTATLTDQQNRDIERVRTIMQEFQSIAELHLGGVPMIVADMIRFIRHDLRTFGVAVLSLMLLLLAVGFRRVRWVVLPIATALLTGVCMLGFLGLVDWRVTVVSANFLSLLLIFSVSLTIHLIVHYREVYECNPDRSQLELVGDMVRAKGVPCLYTVLTTIVAFGSLVVSGIRPVIDFGWIMVLGLALAFVMSFTFFPAILMLLKPVGSGAGRDVTGAIAMLFVRVVQRRAWLIASGAILLVIVSVWGITRLTVENRFIDYFKPNTEIHQGMLLIDEQLGGTTPLEVILDAPSDFMLEPTYDDSESEFDDEREPSITETSYWFNSYMLEDLERVHRYLESLSEAGSVVSLVNGLTVLRELNHGKPLETFELGVLFKRLPAESREALVTPYMADDGNQLRLSVRLYETDPTLRREALLRKIRTHLVDHIGLETAQVHLTGMLVLYNNMLRSLYESQILTLGVVFLAILLMFALVFRSLLVAVVAVIPNLIAAGLVLGIMGGCGIPLDMMSTTIAAISVGIAVDDTIHYVHRFRTELLSGGCNYQTAMLRSHSTVGRAMYYTTVTITTGFSILVLSNFVPSVRFGLLTALAMVTALVADMLILPLLLEKLKPFPLPLQRGSNSRR